MGVSDRADRLRQARQAAGFESPAEAAERFGWSKNTYKSNENGAAPYSFKKAKEYAAAFKVRAEWLYDASGEASAAAPKPTALTSAVVGDPLNLAELREYIAAKNGAPKPASAGRLRVVERRVPVVGEVAAGRWIEVAAVSLEDVDEYLPIDIPGYERAALRALRVVGPSMNLVYPEGRYVVTAHPVEAGIRIGDYVVVERYKADLVEVTLKELVVEADGAIALWPRSDHPDFQKPIYLKEADPLDQTLPKITGVVVGDYSRRVRPPMQFERGP